MAGVRFSMPTTAIRTRAAGRIGSIARSRVPSPVGIEQDMAWYVDPATGAGRAVVTHQPETTGAEPDLRMYFFERVRPVIEKALAENDRAKWPLIVMHFDFKDNQKPLLEAVWKILGEYEPWITTAVKTADPHELMPFDMKPLLVLTEDSDAQEEVFFRDVKVGERLRLFGSAHTVMRKDVDPATIPPNELLTERPTNYRRWWNNSWNEVEEGGQRHAGEWTAADAARLQSLVGSRAWARLLDSLLHARWVYRGHESRLVGWLQLRFRRSSAAALESGHRCRRQYDRDRSVRRTRPRSWRALIALIAVGPRTGSRPTAL